MNVAYLPVTFFPLVTPRRRRPHPLFPIPDVVLIVVSPHPPHAVAISVPILCDQGVTKKEQKKKTEGGE
jgi:hypothetical protein